MPNTIEVRQLKSRASHVIRSVREDATEYIITVHGEPVAILRPLSEDENKRLRQIETDRTMREMRSLAEEIAAAWKSEKSAVEIITEQRR